VSKSRFQNHKRFELACAIAQLSGRVQLIIGHIRETLVGEPAAVVVVPLYDRQCERQHHSIALAFGALPSTQSWDCPPSLLRLFTNASAIPNYWIRNNAR
jgi:hypothetical protein